MFPNPLHPAVVHFPVVLAFLLPIVAIGALWSIRRGSRMRAKWSIPVVLAGFLLVSSWVAEQTGEAQEDRVERVVTEQPLETHEEAAETFVVATAGVFLLFVVGLLPGLAGKLARTVGVAAALGLVAGAVVVGHSGGQLVYQHGAASAYAESSSRSDATVSRRDNDDDKR